MSEHDLQALRRIYAAINRGDVEELAADVAHDTEWSLPERVPWGGAHVWTLTDGVAPQLRGFYDTEPIVAALEGRAQQDPEPAI